MQDSEKKPKQTDTKYSESQNKNLLKTVTTEKRSLPTIQNISFSFK